MTGLVLHSSVKIGLLYQQESEFAANTFRGVLGNFVWSTVYIPPLNVQILWRIVLGAKSEKKQIFGIWQLRCLVCAVYVDVCLFPAPLSKGLRGWRGEDGWGGLRSVFAKGFV